MLNYLITATLVIPTVSRFIHFHNSRRVERIDLAVNNEFKHIFTNLKCSVGKKQREKEDLRKKSERKNPINLNCTLTRCRCFLQTRQFTVIKQHIEFRHEQFKQLTHFLTKRLFIRRMSLMPIWWYSGALCSCKCKNKITKNQARRIKHFSRSFWIAFGLSVYTGRWWRWWRKWRSGSTRWKQADHYSEDQ